MATLAARSLRTPFVKQAILRRVVTAGSPISKFYSGESGTSNKPGPPPPAKPSASSSQANPPASKPQPTGIAQAQSAQADNTTYKVTEYYSYNEMSFYDYEIEMAPSRIKQPSKYDTRP